MSSCGDCCFSDICSCDISSSDFAGFLNTNACTMLGIFIMLENEKELSTSLGIPFKFNC